MVHRSIETPDLIVLLFILSCEVIVLIFCAVAAQIALRHTSCLQMNFAGESGAGLAFNAGMLYAAALPCSVMTDSNVLSCAVRLRKYHSEPAPPQRSTRTKISHRSLLLLALLLLR